jgi:UDP-glucuronate 4-epimerase
LIELIAGRLGVPPRVEELPLQPGDVPITYADVAKAKRLWGWEPKVAMDEGVDRFVDWFNRERRR